MVTPILTSYSSSVVMVDASGGLSTQGFGYLWDGTQFVLRAPQPFQTYSSAEVNSFVSIIAADSNSGNAAKYAFDGSPANAMLGVMEIALLRLAIDRGLTTQAKAVTTFGGLTVGGVLPFAFLAINPPQTIEASDEVSVLRAGISSGAKFSVSDALLKVNPFINDTAIAKAGDPWAVPAGVSTNVAIATAWQSSSIPSVAAASAAVLGGSGGAGSSGEGHSVVPFAISLSPQDTGIQQIYLAMFKRPADAQGYLFYSGILSKNGGDVIDASAGFGASPEYLQLYAGLDNAARVDAVYMNLFNRHAEQDGLTYWGNKLGTGELTISNISIAILTGAQNVDLTTVNNRISVSKVFTQMQDSWTKSDAYSGSQAAAAVRAVIDSVTADPATVTAAVAKLPVVLKTIGVVGTVTTAPTGDTIVLADRSRVDTITYNASSVGKTDQVVNFGGDKFDVSAFKFSTAGVSLKPAGTDAIATANGFFAGKGVAIVTNASDTTVYIDANKDGSYNAATDITVKLTGSMVIAGDFWF